MAKTKLEMSRTMSPGNRVPGWWGPDWSERARNLVGEKEHSRMHRPKEAWPRWPRVREAYKRRYV